MTAVPAHWSHSSVKAILNGCAYRWYLDKVVKIETPDHPRQAAGRAYHAAVEVHEEARRRWSCTAGRAGARDGVDRDTMREVARGELDGGDVDWSAEGYDETSDAVTAALTHWWDAPIPEGQPGEGRTLRDRAMGWKPLAIERRFDLWMHGVTPRPFVGYPDAIYLDEDAGAVVVVDHKSSKSFRRFPHDGKGVRDQAAAYVRAAVEARGMPAAFGEPIRFEYHVARTKASEHPKFQPVRVVTVDVDDLDRQYVEQRIREVDGIVAAGRFDKYPEWFLCSPEWCPHHQAAGGTCDPDGPPER